MAGKPCKITFFDLSTGFPPTFNPVVSSAIDASGVLSNTLYDSTVVTVGQVQQKFGLFSVTSNSGCGLLPALNTLPLTGVSSRGSFPISGGTTIDIDSTKMYLVTLSLPIDLVGSGSEILSLALLGNVNITYIDFTMYVALGAILNPNHLSVSGVLETGNSTLTIAIGTSSGAANEIKATDSKILIQEIN